MVFSLAYFFQSSIAESTASEKCIVFDKLKCFFINRGFSLFIIFYVFFHTVSHCCRYFFLIIIL